MSDIQEKIEQIGKTLKDEFYLMATGDLSDKTQAKQMQALAIKAAGLQNELAGAFDVAVTTPMETLTGILAGAEAQGITNTADLKEALAQFTVIDKELPKGCCPTLAALRDAARKALNLPNP